MMNKLQKIQTMLKAAIPAKVGTQVFFKTGVGHYAEHEQFIGVSVPNIRKIAKEFPDLALKEIKTLLQSLINEERLLALILLVNQYKKADHDLRQKIYEFYLKNMRHINNWNLVDASAHLIVGMHLYQRDKQLLTTLAQSKILWERRIAIVATWYLIRQNDLKPTYKIAKILLNDEHDLIHKAVGWMLREAGKRDSKQLMEFLNKYAHKMPRTMLRYAIEKFPEATRKAYLAQTK